MPQRSATSFTNAMSITLSMNIALHPQKAPARSPGEGAGPASEEEAEWRSVVCASYYHRVLEDRFESELFSSWLDSPVARVYEHPVNAAG